MAKIQETVAQIGRQRFEFVKGDKEAVERIFDAPEDARACVGRLRPEQSERQAP